VTVAQPIAINHPTVATPSKASHAHGHTLALRKPAVMAPRSWCRTRTPSAQTI